MESALLFVEPGSPVPPVDPPFGVLLDADDAEWAEDEHLRKSAVALLEAGCRYFVCFGERSEEVHDRIDDCIVEKTVLGGQADYEGVITTYHTDESVADVAEFFLTCALPQMRGALVIARDGQKWSAALSRTAIGG
jgi:hypothetical protein